MVDDLEGRCLKAAEAIDNLMVLHHADMYEHHQASLDRAKQWISERDGTTAVWADTVAILRKDLTEAEEQ